MGGSGSGFQGIARPGTDGVPRLDVRWLAREHLVEVGRAVFSTMTWDRGGEPIATVGIFFDIHNRILLDYVHVIIRDMDVFTCGFATSTARHVEVAVLR